MKSDHCSKFSNFSNWKEEAWKIFKPVTSMIPVPCLTQQIDLAPNELNKLTSPPMCGFTAQLVQHRTVSQSSRVRIPLKPWYFSGFFLPIASIGKKITAIITLHFHLQLQYKYGFHIYFTLFTSVSYTHLTLPTILRV